MNEYLANFEEMEWDTPAPGIRCKIAKNHEQQVRLVEFTKEMAPHWCELGHYGFILEGELEIEFRNGTHVYKVGEGLLIPGGDTHKHKGRVLTEKVRAIFVENV